MHSSLTGRSLAATVSITRRVSGILSERKQAEERWPKIRVFLFEALKSSQWDLLMGIMISMNIVLIVIETDAEARSEATELWVSILDRIFSIIYILEILCRVYTYRSDFFFSARDVLDATIVLTDTIAIFINLLSPSALPSMMCLRVFRMFRLIRAFRFLMLFPQLQIMIRGLLSAFRAMFYGLILIIACLVILSILAVQIIHPLNEEISAIGMHDDSCVRCDRAFGSVWQSSLTLTQTLIAQDNWGQLFLPIIEQYPATYIFFLLSLMIISVSVMNLILAVILDAAAEARIQCDHERAAFKEEEREQNKKSLLELCETLDQDGDKTLTLPELLKGFSENQDLRDTLLAMDIQEGDIETVFHILDEDRSGEVSYEEFVNQMQQIRSNDEHTMLVFIRHHTKCLHEKLVDHLEDWLHTVANQLRVSGFEDSTAKGFAAEHDSAKPPLEAPSELRCAASVEQSVHPFALPDGDAPVSKEIESLEPRGTVKLQAIESREPCGAKALRTLEKPKIVRNRSRSQSNLGGGLANSAAAEIEIFLESLQLKLDTLLSATASITTLLGEPKPSQLLAEELGKDVGRIRRPQQPRHCGNN